MIISEIQSEIGHCSCDSAKFKATADFSHHAILCMTLSLSHPYSLKTKSSQFHYVVMTRSETKFQAPLNRRYQEVLAITEHLTIKTMSTGHARHG